MSDNTVLEAESGDNVVEVACPFGDHSLCHPLEDSAHRRGPRNSPRVKRAGSTTGSLSRVSRVSSADSQTDSLIPACGACLGCCIIEEHHSPNVHGGVRGSCTFISRVQRCRRSSLVARKRTRSSDSQSLFCQGAHQPCQLAATPQEGNLFPLLSRRPVASCKPQERMPPFPYCLAQEAHGNSLCRYRCHTNQIKPYNARVMPQQVINSYVRFRQTWWICGSLCEASCSSLWRSRRILAASVPSSAWASSLNQGCCRASFAVIRRDGS